MNSLILQGFRHLYSSTLKISFQNLRLRLHLLVALVPDPDAVLCRLDLRISTRNTTATLQEQLVVVNGKQKSRTGYFNRYVPHTNKPICHSSATGEDLFQGGLFGVFAGWLRTST